MSCKYAKYDPDDNRFQCNASGDGCLFQFPNSKLCATIYGEGPDAESVEEKYTDTRDLK